MMPSGISCRQDQQQGQHPATERDTTAVRISISIGSSCRSTATSEQPSQLPPTPVRMPCRRSTLETVVGPPKHELRATKNGTAESLKFLHTMIGRAAGGSATSSSAMRAGTAAALAPQPNSHMHAFRCVSVTPPLACDHHSTSSVLTHSACHYHTCPVMAMPQIP